MDLEVLGAVRGRRTMLLLETTAGQGNGIGHDFSQLAEIIRLVGLPGRMARQQVVREPLRLPSYNYGHMTYE